MVFGRRLVVAVSFLAGVGGAVVATGVLAAGPGSEASAARILASAPLPLPPYPYRLAVEDRRIAVVGVTSGPCSTRLLNPATLRLDSVVPGCASTASPAGSGTRVVVALRRSGDAIRVARTSHLTRRVVDGPTLVTLPNWDWNHSSVAWGNGKLWIYALDGSASVLLEVSAATGTLLHRFGVAAGPNPFIAVDADGLWISESAWGGSSCANACTLWHVATASDRLVAQRRLGVRTQWLVASGHSVFADVLTSLPRGAGRWRQAIWRLDGPRAHVAYTAAATLLPSSDFALGTGYVVVGNETEGYFTLAQLGDGTTPAAVGACDATAAVRVIGIDPTTGRQRPVATLPRDLAGTDLDCHLSAGQAVFDDGSLYLLADPLTGAPGSPPGYQRVLRVTP